MSKEFFTEIDEVFKDILNTNKHKIIVVDAETEIPIEGVKYEKMFFDSQLNMYKITDEGKVIKIANKKVKAILKS